MEVKADLLLLDGKVITVDSEFNIVEAVAVKDGKIFATGTTPEIEGLKGEGTEVVNLGGKTVLPGLIDSHLHVVSTGMLLSQINCRTPPMGSISDILTAVKETSDKAEPGEWILGRGWDQVKLSDHRNPT
ncbi:amidohydrolase family protein, partial [Candidatus Bathyarchaeota archaeon]|nr:amidohydrolase family protein [Candidatus Bathyarchaeota archaeon]